MRRSILLLSAALSAVSAPAFAQTAQESDDSASEPADIIVTATRREQALSDVPLAVSAISGEALQNSGVTDLRALNQLAPSLIVSGATSESNFTARIRGIGTVGENPGLESSVALFIDGVYRSRTGVGLSELGEVERIEVLRGPQGTLFGRNASAGLLNVVTKKPSYDFGGYAAATYGNYDYLRLEAGINAPIIQDKLAAKLEGVWQQRDGFIRNVTPGAPDVNDRDRFLVRGQLLWDFSDDISLRLIGDYSKRDENCCAAAYLNPVQNLSRAADGSVNFGANTLVPLLNALGANLQLAPSGEPFVRRTATTAGFPYRADSTDYGFSGELNWDLGGANLTSVTAYRNYRYTQGQDSDFNALDLLRRTDEDRQFKTFTQELRVQGEAFGGRVDWLVGGYYANESLFQDQDLRYGNDYEKFANCLIAPLFGAALVNTASPTCSNSAAFPGYQGYATLLNAPRIGGTGITRNTFEQKSRNYAFFTHEIIDIIEDKLTLTLGGRYTNERKKLRSTVNFGNTLCTALINSPLQALQAPVCSINATAIGFNGTEPGTTRKESEWTGTAVLAFKPVEDVLLYASYSKGYKAGGFNLDTSALDRACNPSFDTTCAGRLALPANTQFNARAEITDLQFEPEKVDAYEVGVKFDGRKVDVNVALFHSAFENYQLNTFNGTTFEVTNVASCKDNLNGADADGSIATGRCAANRLRAGVVAKGAEIEIAAYPARNLAVNAGLTYLNARYRKNLTGTGGNPLSPVLFQLPGRRTFSAEYALTTSLSWTPSISEGMKALVYLDARMQSDVNTGSDLDFEKIQDGYALVNARIGLFQSDRKWSVEFFGQNIFNKKVQQIAADAPGQGSGTFRAVAAPASTGLAGTANQLFIAFPGEPRTYGVTVRTRF